MTVLPIVALVLARFRRRAATTGAAIAAVAAATALIGLIAGIGLVATDATIARALATTGADRPVIRASTFSPSSRDAASVDATADDALGRLEGSVGPIVRGILVHELLDLDAPVFELIIAVDDPGPWTTLIQGRLPAPCIDGRRCEAVLLALDPGEVPLTVAHPAPDLEFTIVGRGQIDAAVPFGGIDQRGPYGSEPGGGQYQTGRASPAVLLVSGVDAIATSPALEGTGRTYVWTAPLLVEGVHPWTVSALRDTAMETSRMLGADQAGFGLTSPLPLIDMELARASVARDRSLLVGSLGLAVLLAFTVFLAFVAREDVRAEVTRLTVVGARRRDRWTFLALEALLPIGIGGIVGWLAGAIGVAAVAAWTGSPVGPIVGGAMLEPAVLLAGAGILVLSLAATMVAIAPGLAGATTLRLVGAVGVTTATLLGWQLLAGSGPDSTPFRPVGPGEPVGPLVVLLPASIAFLVALVVAVALPPIIRGAARRSAGSPLAVRLALLSIAREPSRPAATITLLAFSLGAIVFSIGWSASLDEGIRDGAAYRSGLDLRVTELGTGLSISGSVVPIDRYAGLGADVRAVAVYRDATTADEGGRTEILALPPSALAGLPGWRTDFADTPIADMATRLEVQSPAGGWRQQGHQLAVDAMELVLRFRYVGRPLRLDAIVATTAGDTATIHLGDLDPSMTEVRGTLPPGARGGLVTALILRNPGLVKGSGHQDELRRATITWLGLTGLVAEDPIDVEIFTTAAHIIRAPALTDGLRLPAIVSPDLEARAGPEGELDLQLTADATIGLRVVGVARFLPTVVDDAPRFVAVSIEPFLVALAATVPGAGRANEMWLDLPDDPGRLAAVRAALREDPFRFAQITDKAATIAQRSDDPLSVGILWTLVAAGLAGLLLALSGLLLGAVTDLADPRGEAADLEAQGVAPSVLRQLATTRMAVLVGAGAVAGTVVGLVLSTVVTGALSLTADGLVPIPPLVGVVPLATIAILVGAVVMVVLAVTAGLASRAYGAATLGERRAGQAGQAGRGGVPRALPAERIDD